VLRAHIPRLGRAPEPLDRLAIVGAVARFAVEVAEVMLRIRIPRLSSAREPLFRFARIGCDARTFFVVEP
jgi:hypothetical protein